MAERDDKVVVDAGARGDVRGGDWIRSLRKQLVELRWPIIGIFIVFGVIFGGLIVIRASTGIAIAEFTRDPLGFTGLPVYKGSVSNLGVLIMMGAAAISFFTYGLVRSGNGGTRPASFLLAAGVITLVLTLDDLYMLHEVVFPDYVGIPENVVYAIYAVAVAWLVIRYRSTILRTPFLLLGLAFAGFALSILSDAVAPYVTIPAFYVFEDGGKFIGIVSWTVYFVMVSKQYVDGVISSDRVIAVQEPR